MSIVREIEANNEQGVVALTSTNLLDICSLPGLKKSCKAKHVQLTRQERMEILKHWHQYQSLLLEKYLFTTSDPKSGCFALHWSAGTGFDEAVAFILDHYSCAYSRWPTHEAAFVSKIGDPHDELSDCLVNQWAQKPSTGRTPLHYAARNCHLSTCRLLIETYQADPNPKCHRGKVTPLQLGVWQNQLEIVRYLVDINTNKRSLPPGTPMESASFSIVLETNAFQCGLNHWIGLIPKRQWRSNDGTGVLPLARYLHDKGVSYLSIDENKQNQGHTPLHKAAWGGNIALMKYFRDEHGVYDNVQDACGNFAADLAQMGGHCAAQEWLQTHGSLSRHESCNVIGVTITASDEEIQARYKTLARQYHPDKYHRTEREQCAGVENDFVRIKAAYEHLIYHKGVGRQRNPKYESLQMLTAASDTTSSATVADPTNTSITDNVTLTEDDRDLFHARILAIVSDYGDKGFPVSAIAKRWNQIWPDRPFPMPEQYVIRVPIVTGKKGNEIVENRENATTADFTKQPVIVVEKQVKLLKFLKWRCKDVLYFRKVDGAELAFAKNSICTNVHVGDER